MYEIIRMIMEGLMALSEDGEIRRFGSDITCGNCVGSASEFWIRVDDKKYRITITEVE